jgi:glycosyltransferase involved in cell wall biosynthesis
MRIAVLTTDNREHFRDYAASVPYFGAAPEALLQGFSGMSDLEVHVVSCTREPVSSPEKLAPNIWHHTLLVPKAGWLRICYLGCVRAVRRRLKTIAPDIVHGQGTERDCAMNAVFSGFPNVLTIHGNIAELARRFRSSHGLPGVIQAKLENLVLKRTLGVFCNSEYTENLVRPRTRRTWRVPNAIRELFFTSAQPLARQKKRVLLNVGVISERKRQWELLDVARRLHQQGLQVEMQFIGDISQDAYSSKFRERIKEAEAAGYARYLGTRTGQALIDCFDAADGMVHFPSEEAFGLVVAEGMARHLKFFGANTGGIVDICRGVAGAELFDADDWSGLATALANWLRASDPKSTAAADIMRERYHPSVIARRHLEIYRETLNKIS